MGKNRDNLQTSRQSLHAFYDAYFGEPKFGALVPTCASVGTTSVVLANANTNRRYMAIFNDGDNSNAYLGLGVVAELNKGVRLNPSGGAYEITALNLTIGTISAITAIASQNITWVEGTE